MQTESSFIRKKAFRNSRTWNKDEKNIKKISEDPGLDDSGLNSCRLVFTDEKITRRKGRHKNVRAGGAFELTAAVVGFDIPSVSVCVSGRFCSSSRANSSRQHGPTRGIGSTRETWTVVLIPKLTNHVCHYEDNLQLRSEGVRRLRHAKTDNWLISNLPDIFFAKFVKFYR